MSYTRCGSSVDILHERQEKGWYTDAAQGFPEDVSIHCVEGGFDVDVGDIERPFELSVKF